MQSQKTKKLMQFAALIYSKHSLNPKLMLNLPAALSPSSPSPALPPHSCKLPFFRHHSSQTPNPIVLANGRGLTSVASSECFLLRAYESKPWNTRFSFFRDKIMKLRVWYFHDLQVRECVLCVRVRSCVCVCVCVCVYNSATAAAANITMS